MQSASVNISSPDGSTISVGRGKPLLLIGGPCALESEEICRRVAGTMQELCAKLSIPYVFKASFDKANRTSLDSFRGPGITKGLSLLNKIREDFSVPVVSDIHDAQQAKEAADVLDILQIPAFLCRQHSKDLFACRERREFEVCQAHLQLLLTVAHRGYLRPLERYNPDGLC